MSTPDMNLELRRHQGSGPLIMVRARNNSAVPYLERKPRPASPTRKSCRTPRPIHSLGDLLGTLRRDGLAANELVLHLPAFVRSLDLPFELLVGTVPWGLLTQRDQFTLPERK